MNRRTFLRATGTSSLVSVGLAGCTTLGSSDGVASDETLVEMTPDDAFEPAELTVSSGETVVWKTVGYLGVDALTADHTVTAYEDDIPDDAAYFASGDFSSEQAARDGYTSGDGGGVDGGDTYEYTFDVPGRYEYFCIPHEAHMTGVIVVEDN